LWGFESRMFELPKKLLTCSYVRLQISAPQKEQWPVNNKLWFLFLLFLHFSLSNSLFEFLSRYIAEYLLNIFCISFLLFLNYFANVHIGFFLDVEIFFITQSFDNL